MINVFLDKEKLGLFANKCTVKCVMCLQNCIGILNYS